MDIHTVTSKGQNKVKVGGEGVEKNRVRSGACGINGSGFNALVEKMENQELQ